MATTSGRFSRFPAVNRDSDKKPAAKPEPVVEVEAAVVEDVAEDVSGEDAPKPRKRAAKKASADDAGIN